MTGALDKLERSDSFAAKFFVLTDGGVLHMFRAEAAPSQPTTALFVKTCSGFYDESRTAWLLRVVGKGLGDDGQLHRRIWTLRAKDPEDLRQWLDKINEQILDQKHVHSPNPSFQSDLLEYHHPPPLVCARARKNSAASSLSQQSIASTVDMSDWDQSASPVPPPVPEKDPDFLPTELLHPRPVQTISPVVKTFNFPPPPVGSPPADLQRFSFSPSLAVTEPISPEHPPSPLGIVEEAEEPPASTESANKAEEPRETHPRPFVLPRRTSSMPMHQVVNQPSTTMRKSVAEQEQVKKVSREEMWKKLLLVEDLDSDTEEEEPPKKLFGWFKR
ncbi:hypothetical protein HDU98_004601 [Podochytrium sp. JEL0797]|nr:hypothetical protein HDU98_004601 [Podochytrium sp. JEL0797]